MDYKKLVRKFYILAGLRWLSVGFLTPIYTFYLLNEIGLSGSDYGWVTFISYAVSFLMEIPTGAFADRYGRKKSILLSCGFGVASALVYLAAKSFGDCLVAESLGAMGWAFLHGAANAWLKDELEGVGRKDLVDGAIAGVTQWTNIALAAGTLIGGFLARSDIRWPWYLGVMLTLVQMVIIWRGMKEKYVLGDCRNNCLGFRDTIRTIIGAWRDRNLRMICLLGLVQCLTTVAAASYWPVFYGGEKADMFWIGALGTGMYGACFFGAKLVEKGLANRKVADYEEVLLVAQVVLGVGLIVMVTTNWLIISVEYLLIQEVARGIYGAASEAYLHRSIKREEERATVASMKMMGEQFGGLTGALVMAFWIGVSKPTVELVVPLLVVSGIASIVLTIAIGAYFKDTRRG